MLQNLTSSTFSKYEQVTSQPRFKARKIDFHFFLGRVAESHCRGAHVEREKKFIVAMFAYRLPHQLIPWARHSFSSLLSASCMSRKAHLYTVDYLHAFALWLLVRCAGGGQESCVLALQLSLGSVTQFTFLPKKIEDIRYALTQIPTYLSNVSQLSLPPLLQFQRMFKTIHLLVPMTLTASSGLAFHYFSLPYMYLHYLPSWVLTLSF